MDNILTVIIPSYNMEAYLPKCLESLVVNPELMDRVEVLVVNDGSNDRTSAIGHMFAEKYPTSIKVIDKQNGHYGSCVNTALKVATGEFVKILDADDSYETVNFEKWLSRLVEISDTLNDVDGLVTDYFTVDNKGRITKLNQFRIPTDKVCGIEDIPANYAFPMHAIAWRTKMLRDMGYVQTEGIMYTDTEWMMYPLCRAKKFYYFPKPVYRYLVGREGQSMDPDVYYRCMWQRIMMFSKMLNVAKNTKLDSASQNRIINVAQTGILAFYKAAADSEREKRDRAIGKVDDCLKQYGAEVYDSLNESWLVRRWRQRRRLGLFDEVVLKFHNFKSAIVRACKDMIKGFLFLCR